MDVCVKVELTRRTPSFSFNDGVTCEGVTCDEFAFEVKPMSLPS